MGMNSYTYIGPVITVKCTGHVVKEKEYGCSYCRTTMQPDSNYCPTCGRELDDYDVDVEVWVLPINFYDVLDMHDWWNVDLSCEEDNTYHLLMNYGINQSDYLLDIDTDIEEFIQPLPKPYPIEKFKESKLYEYLINCGLSIDFTPQAVVRYWS